MSEYYFHLDHLTVGYDKKPLIKDICIGIEKGEIVTLQLGERYRFPPCFHGDASEKAGKERRADAVYPDAYRGWLPDAEGRVKEEKI